MDYISSAEAAKKWGISIRRVQGLCMQSRIKGAERLGTSWAIPKDAVKPVDPRKLNKRGELSNGISNKE